MVTVDDVSANVDWTIGEARRQIDQQMAASGEIDGRANGFLGLLGGITGVTAIFGDIRLDTTERVAATTVTAVFAIIAALFFAATLLPRGGASYGTDLKETTASVDTFSSLGFKLGMAAALTAARDRNTAFLAKRQWMLTAGIWCFAIAVALVMAMIWTGAVIPAAKP